MKYIPRYVEICGHCCLFLWLTFMLTRTKC